MADYTKYTKQEMQAYAIAKNIKENQIVIVGTGLPLIGAGQAPYGARTTASTHSPKILVLVGSTDILITYDLLAGLRTC